ncbi:MAG: hypothetical protein KC657_04405 [Myxococcales bacterium]|nr:hypothetical protein [Myxococcales bacterium]
MLRPPTAALVTVTAMALAGPAAAQEVPQSAAPDAAPAPAIAAPATGSVTPPVAAPGPAAPGPTPAPGAPPDALSLDFEKTPPPPTNVIYLQYGVAFTAEAVLAPGPICDNVEVPCIIGQGAGVAARLGWRSTGAWYLGVAYAFSKQDPNKLYRLAILQQARAEARYYVDTGRQLQPYASGGGGAMGYGNEWGVDTLGPTVFVGGGVEAQITRRTVVGVGLTYRMAYLSSFVDTSGTARDAGLPQFLSLELTLEHRDPIH